jgi:hypothetical protein
MRHLWHSKAGTSLTDFSLQAMIRAHHRTHYLYLYTAVWFARRDSDWLNAGRRLIDKTYIQILLVTQQLNHTPFVNAGTTAAALDNFIRLDMAPHWGALNSNDNNLKQQLFLN